MRELVTKKNLIVRKIDTGVNIADCLTKPLFDQCFGTLRTKMRLWQATNQKKAEQGREGKSKINLNKPTRRTKSIVSETQGTEERALSENVDWKGNDQEANELGYKSRIQQGAEEQKRASYEQLTQGRNQELGTSLFRHLDRFEWRTIWTSEFDQLKPVSPWN